MKLPIRILLTAAVASATLVACSSNKPKPAPSSDTSTQTNTQSRDTGGKYYYASGLNQLDEAFRRISEELRTQYLLAYYPSRRLAESDFRKIDVQIVAPDAEDLKSRNRSGYYTSKAH